jgi:hypothetical protein
MASGMAHSSRKTVEAHVEVLELVLVVFSPPHKSWGGKKKWKEVVMTLGNVLGPQRTPVEFEEEDEDCNNRRTEYTSSHPYTQSNKLPK